MKKKKLIFSEIKNKKKDVLHMKNLFKIVEVRQLNRNYLLLVCAAETKNSVNDEYSAFDYTGNEEKEIDNNDNSAIDNVMVSELCKGVEFDNKTIQNDDQIYEGADEKNDLQQDECTKIIVENGFNGDEGCTAIEENEVDLDERLAIVESEVNPDERHTAIRNDINGHKGASIDRKEVHSNKEPANKKKRCRTQEDRTKRDLEEHLLIPGCNTCKRKKCAKNIGEDVRLKTNSTFWKLDFTGRRHWFESNILIIPIFRFRVDRKKYVGRIQREKTE